MHILAKNYSDPEDSNMFKCEDHRKYRSAEVDTVKVKGSQYKSNKRLSDETAYVLNRKNQKELHGNNLEKPHVFLKRT